MYSSKLFVGNIPITLSDSDIRGIFVKYGNPTVYKVMFHFYKHFKCCHIIFEDPESVVSLLKDCHISNNKYYLTISATIELQISPWKITDSLYSTSKTLNKLPYIVNSRKIINVKRVPLSLTAYDLAQHIQRMFGDVRYTRLHTDIFKYPDRGAYIIFLTHESYILAVTTKYVRINDTIVTVYPYILPNSLCDECQDKSNIAIYFCTHIRCLQYYCDKCNHRIHSNGAHDQSKVLHLTKS